MILPFVGFGIGAACGAGWKACAPDPTGDRPGWRTVQPFPEGPPVPRVKAQRRPTPSPPAARGQPTLDGEIKRLETEPCETRLVFEKLWSWDVTCDGCLPGDRRPAANYYPRAFLDTLDAVSIGGRISMTEVFQIGGICP